MSTDPEEGILAAGDFSEWYDPLVSVGANHSEPFVTKGPFLRTFLYININVETQYRLR